MQTSLDETHQKVSASVNYKTQNGTLTIKIGNRIEIETGPFTQEGSGTQVRTIKGWTEMRAQVKITRQESQKRKQSTGRRNEGRRDFQKNTWKDYF